MFELETLFYLAIVVAVVGSLLFDALFLLTGITLPSVLLRGVLVAVLVYIFTKSAILGLSLAVLWCLFLVVCYVALKISAKNKSQNQNV